MKNSPVTEVYKCRSTTAKPSTLFTYPNLISFSLLTKGLVRGHVQITHCESACGFVTVTGATKRPLKVTLAATEFSTFLISFSELCKSVGLIKAAQKIVHYDLTPSIVRNSQNLHTPHFKIQFTQINYLRFICFTSWPCLHVIVGGGSGVYSIKHVKFIVLPTSMNKSGPLKISVTASTKHRSKSKLQLKSISLAQDTYL